MYTPHIFTDVNTKIFDKLILNYCGQLKKSPPPPAKDILRLISGTRECHLIWKKKVLQV